MYYLKQEWGYGEVLALKRSDIDFNNNIIHVRRTLTKGKDDKIKLGDKTKTYAGMRDVPLSNFLKGILKKNNNIDFLFLLSDGRIYSATEQSTVILNALQKIVI